MNILKTLSAIFLFGGNPWLRDYEEETINYFINQFETDDAKILLNQLAKYNIVQRSPDGRILQFIDTSDQYRKKWNVDLKIDMEGKKREKI